MGMTGCGAPTGAATGRFGLTLNAAGVGVGRWELGLWW